MSTGHAEGRGVPVPADRYDQRTPVLPGEEWRDYRTQARGHVIQVSSMGRMRRIDPSSGTAVILVPTVTHGGHGYMRCGHTLIHHAVMEAFGPERPLTDGRVCIHHANQDRYDNRISNLGWVTYAENNLAENRRCSCPVELLGPDGSAIASYPSIRAAADARGLDRSTAHGYICGRAADPSGLTWRRADSAASELERRASALQVMTEYHRSHPSPDILGMISDIAAEAAAALQSADMSSARKARVSEAVSEAESYIAANSIIFSQHG